jgi:hypothetical protein
VQVVVTQPFSSVGPEGVQVPAWTGVELDDWVQVVCSWPLSSVAAAGVQLPTAVGPLTIVGEGQVVVVQ